MGELVFIGLGLHDEKGITLRGLEEARSAEVVFMELYTSGRAGATLGSVERLIGKKIRRLSRTEVEDGRLILEAAAKQKVAFLVVGDPMAATTHVDLRLRAPSGSRCTSSGGLRRFRFRPRDSARRVRSRGSSRTVVPVSTRSCCWICGRMARCWPLRTRSRSSCGWR